MINIDFDSFNHSLDTQQVKSRANLAEKAGQYQNLDLESSPNNELVFESNFNTEEDTIDL